MGDASYYKSQVRRDVGDVGRDAVFRLVFPVESTGGTWTLAFAGQDSADVARFATPATVQSALEAVPTIGAGNILVELRAFVVDGQQRFGFALTFTGELGAQVVPQPVADGTDLTPTGDIAVQVEEAGQRPNLNAVRLDEMWDIQSAKATDPYLRYLYMRWDALWELRALTAPLVNQKDGDQQRDYAAQFEHYTQMLSDTEAEIEARLSGSQSDNAATLGQTLYGKLSTVTPSGNPWPFRSAAANRRGHC